MAILLRPVIISRFYQSALRLSEDECWPWISTLDKDGYGVFQVEYIQYRAHVIAYAIANNLDYITLLVLHSCDNPKCCNPKHLFLGTTQDNTRDTINKGRKARGEDSNRTTLVKEEILEIREKYKSNRYSQQQLAYEYGVCQTTISGIIRRRLWHHI